MMRAVYIPGHGAIHRCPAGTKLLLLALAAIVVATGGAKAVVIVAAVIAGAWYWAEIGTVQLFQALKPAAVILLFIFIAQLLLRDLGTATLVAAKLAVLIAAAALVSATTKVSDMLAALERALAPLRRFGVNADHVAFMVVLAIRFVPALFRIGAEVREAQRARGLAHSPTAAVVPMLIRALREADDVAEALAARGWSPR